MLLDGKEDEEKNDKTPWYSDLEKEAMIEAEGDIRAEKQEAREDIESGIIYKTGSKPASAEEYAHMHTEPAEYHSHSEDEEEERFRRY